MELTPDTVEALAADYPAVQPLAATEEEHLETLPAALANGGYGWRDVEWIVQWYFRRFLGGYPDADRRAAEAAFGENEFDDVNAAITRAAEAETTTRKLEILTGLTGVDGSVATAFLQFLDPERYLVLSEREWNALVACNEVSGPYPTEPSPAAYERYLETCRTVADRCDRDLWTVYRALWVIGAEEKS